MRMESAAGAEAEGEGEDEGEGEADVASNLRSADSKSLFEVLENVVEQTIN